MQIGGSLHFGQQTLKFNSSKSLEPANEMMKNEDWNLRNMLDRSSWKVQRGV